MKYTIEVTPNPNRMGWACRVYNENSALIEESPPMRDRSEAIEAGKRILKGYPDCTSFDVVEGPN